MDVDFIMKVAGVGMIVAVVCQILGKVGREEQATLVSISGIVIILVLVIERIGDLLESLKRIFGL
jgi:stage III sporulation protein AC